MKPRLILSIMLPLLFVLFNLQAGDIDTLTAKNVAKNFYFKKANIRQPVPYESITFSHITSEMRDGSVVYHVYNITNSKGFIIVSGDDRTIPVLAYSFESNFKNSEDAPPAFLEWMDARANEIGSLKSGSDVTAISRNEQWDTYHAKPDIPLSYTINDVSPLLTTNWNQGCGYNADCPVDGSGPCGHVYAGCVATAMAQVMKYHNYPPTGTGSNSWTSSTYGLISADFGATTYDWAGMPVPSGAYDPDVEQLFFHCGVSINMDYSPTGSGSNVSTATNSLINYFNYSSNAVYTNKSSYVDSSWAKLMIKECDAGRPVMYRGSGSGGHAFNLDGYQGTDYFHINWGWGGSYNGYFYLDDLTPGSYDFTISQCATVGIEPPDSFPGLDCSGAIPLSCSTPYTGTTIGATNIVNRYGNCYYDATGPEIVHTITTTMPGRISAVVSSSANLVIYLLNDCNKDSLITYSISSLVYDNSLPGTYYLVLDGTNGSEGNYTLTVNCPTVDADLIFLSTNVTPYYVRPLQSNVDLNSWIKNIGNSTAAENEIKYYFSVDNIIDGSDILIDSAVLSSTLPDESQFVSKSVTMPGGLTPGAYYIIYQLDADSVVVESDENLNTSYSYIEVPDTGTMDCSSAVALTSGVRYYGNTNDFGTANIQDYSCITLLDDKEVIHKITAPYTGLAIIEFSEHINGYLYLIASPVCNENACSWNRNIWELTDTLIIESMPVIQGTEYYFITDGKAGINGDYSLMITMPDSCPSVGIGNWGDLDRCSGSGSPVLYTNSGINQCQWYKNGIEIDGAFWETFSPTEAGEYWVEVTENGCTVSSDHLTVSYSPEPDTAHISALGDTIFCYGNSVDLDLYTLGGYTINWAINDEPISGANTSTYTAFESGIYTAQVTNISCTISSNPIEVIVYPLAIEPGNALPVPDTGLISYFEFNGDVSDLSGNKNSNWTLNGVMVGNNRFGDLFEAYYFDGIDDYVYTLKRFTGPDEFTLSFWFKTSTTSGGRLAGFGSSITNQSTLSDRQVYMSDNGNLHFGVNNGSPQTISSTTAYNDVAWHHVAVCLSSAGTKLYIDGTLIDSDPSVTNGGDYNGYWRFAYDTIMPGYEDIPANHHFKGSLDEVKIYSRELLPGEIRTLYKDQVIKATLLDDEVCESTDSTYIVIENSQPGVEYQLRDDSDNSLIGSPVTGTGDTIYLPTGIISSASTFNVLSTQIATGCENELDSLFVFTINETPNITVTISQDSICKGDSSIIQITGADSYNWLPTEGTTTAGPNEFYARPDTNTIYYISGSNGSCTDKDTVIIFVKKYPEVDLGPDVQICDISYLIDAGPGFDSYLWSDGSTGQSITVDTTGTGYGTKTFYIVVTLDGCPDTDTIEVTYNICSSTDLNYSENVWKYYPNPTPGTVTFEFSEEINTAVRIVITDIEGRMVKDVEIPVSSGSKKEIDLRNFSNKVFLVRIISKDKVFTGKLFKQ